MNAETPWLRVDLALAEAAESEEPWLTRYIAELVIFHRF